MEAVTARAAPPASAAAGTETTATQTTQTNTRHNRTQRMLARQPESVKTDGKARYTREWDSRCLALVVRTHQRWQAEDAARWGTPEHVANPPAGRPPGGLVCTQPDAADRHPSCRAGRARPARL